MNDSVFQVRIDSNQRFEAEEIVKHMGLTMADVVRMLTAQIIETGTIPFEIKTNYRPKKKLFASGIAHEHANPDLLKQEKDAWKSYIEGKYGLT